MKRRHVLAATLGGIAARAHPAGERPRRVGWIAFGPAAVVSGWTNGVRTKLQESGMSNLAHEERIGDGTNEGIDRAARELAAWRPDIVVAQTNGATRAAMRNMPGVPIVVLVSANPVQSGLAASLARPGGHVTGAAANPPEIAGKFLEILQVAAPRIRRVAVIRALNTPGFAAYTPHALRAAELLGLTLHYVELRDGDPFDIGTVEAVAPDALYVVLDAQGAHGTARRLIAHGLERKLPSIGGNRGFVEAGGLFTFMPDLDENKATVADYVRRILKGESPASLPFREPSRYQLIVNARTARAIGITITQELRLRVHEVIEIGAA